MGIRTTHSRLKPLSQKGLCDIPTNTKRGFYSDVYTILNRIWLTIWTICAFQVMNPLQWKLHFTSIWTQVIHFNLFNRCINCIKTILYLYLSDSWFDFFCPGLSKVAIIMWFKNQRPPWAPEGCKRIGPSYTHARRKRRRSNLTPLAQWIWSV